MSHSPHRLTYVLFTLVIATAITSVLPSPEPRLPGVIRFGVIDGPGETATGRALAPLAEYLGLTVRRAVQPEVTTTAQLRANLGAYDLALLPAAMVSGWEGAEVLAWAKTRGLGASPSRPILVYPKGLNPATVSPDRIIVGDRASLDDGVLTAVWRELGIDPDAPSIRFGGNVYDHREALAALVHGAYDLAVVREADMRHALSSGMLDRATYAYQAAGAPDRGFALVAGPTLSSSARRRLREAALNLDHLRYERASLRVQAVLEAMGNLGLDGFVPDEVLPSFRP